MTIEIYINGHPADEYSQEEINEIKKELTVKAMKAAGYVPAK